MTTATKEHQWSELAAELKQEATAAREARAEVQTSAATTRRALAAGISRWWIAFVAEWRVAVEALRGAPGLGDLRIIERGPGSIEVHDASASGTLLGVDVDPEGDLRIRRLLNGSGDTRFLTLEPAGVEGIAPAPSALARELLTPFARDVAAWARRSDR